MAKVHQISVSDGGVPKLAVDHAVVGDRGVVGDRQADTEFHGSPDQALCVYSLDVIEALRAEGHPIEPGSAGENLTIEGLDWASLESGMVIEIGAVIAELTFPAAPCRKNARWFVDGGFRRMSHEAHPGWSRWYARVLRGGEIATAEPVVLRSAR